MHVNRVFDDLKAKLVGSALGFAPVHASKGIPILKVSKKMVKNTFRQLTFVMNGSLSL